jgi:hypothetical protein
MFLGYFELSLSSTHVISITRCRVVTLHVRDSLCTYISHYSSLVLLLIQSFIDCEAYTLYTMPILLDQEHRHRSESFLSSEQVLLRPEIYCANPNSLPNRPDLN